MAERWVVIITDNWHFMDQSEDYALPPFESEAAAIAAAVEQVERDLSYSFSIGRSGDEAWEAWCRFGVTPVLSGPHPSSFSAVAYARWRCGLPALDRHPGAGRDPP